MNTTLLRWSGDPYHPLPLFSSAVSAGFPSPADDHLEGELNLHELLVKHPSATFFTRAAGSSMVGAGIHDGDVLVVDRSLEPRDGQIVIAAVDGELTVKRLVKQGHRVWLAPENEDYAVIELQEGQEMVVWGVVTSVIHRL